MLRTEVTVGGCCWAVEPTIRRSLFYEVNAKILCFCGQRSHPQVFAERSGTAEGQDRGDRRDHAGGQRGDAFDRAARQWRELRGISARVGEEIRKRNADAGRSSAVRSQAEEQSQQQRLGQSA